MIENKKVLAQLLPPANTTIDFYVVQSLTQVVISAFVVTNLNSNDDLFSMSIAPSGENISNKQYIYKDVSIGGKDTFVANIGITLNSGDIMRVLSTAGYCTFNLFGVEIT
jgi:hypothetical protein